MAEWGLAGCGSSGEFDIALDEAMDTDKPLYHLTISYPRWRQTNLHFQDVIKLDPKNPKKDLDDLIYALQQVKEDLD